MIGAQLVVPPLSVSRVDHSRQLIGRQITCAAASNEGYESPARLLVYVRLCDWEWRESWAEKSGSVKANINNVQLREGSKIEGLLASK